MKKYSGETELSREFDIELHYVKREE